MKEDEIFQILGKGILAPSADNLQPWKFLIHPEKGQVDILLDPERIKNFCDAGLRVPCIAAGAVIENARLEAAYQGYELEVVYFPVPRDGFQVASLFLKKGNPEPRFERSSPEQRHTNRKFYQGRKPLPALVLEESLRLFSGLEGFKLFWIHRGDPRYSTLTDLIGDADQLRFEAERLHRELYSLIRWKPEEAEKTGDGLDARALEAGLLGTLVFKGIASWSRLARLNRFGMSRMFNQYARFQMRSSAAAGFLVASSQQLTDYLRGGEAMERLWLFLTEAGISLQPMEALPIAILNLQATGGEDWSEAQRKKLGALKGRFFSLFEIGDERGLIFLFRAGYGPRPAVRARRRPLASFIQNFETVSGSKISENRRF